MNINDENKNNGSSRQILVIGGGIMGLGSAWYLSQRWAKFLICTHRFHKKNKSNLSRGYRVTLLEKNKNVAQVASSINGAMLCPSMCASWASLKLILKVRI